MSALWCTLGIILIIQGQSDTVNHECAECSKLFSHSSALKHQMSAQPIVLNNIYLQNVFKCSCGLLKKWIKKFGGN
jgi:hypothetical protein